MFADGTVVTIGGNEIFSAITFRNSATVAAETPGDILRLRGVTSYEEGAYIGQGGIIQDASAFVERSTTVDLGFFDIDGVAENTALELHADLELNVDRVDMNDNQFHGTLQVSDPARLSVNTPLPWTMAGAINVSGGPGTVFAVAGADAEWTGDAFVGQFNQLNFEADISGPGEFTGEGTVEFSGQYSPGGSPAIVSAEGDVVFTDTATYFVEIGGRVPVPNTMCSSSMVKPTSTVCSTSISWTYLAETIRSDRCSATSSGSCDQGRACRESSLSRAFPKSHPTLIGVSATRKTG